MTYKDDFENSLGWSAADTNRRLDTAKGKQFLAFLRGIGVDTVLRYHSSNSANPKTITAAEAKLLSREGFGIIAIFQDNNTSAASFSFDKGKAAGMKAMAAAQAIGQPKGSSIFFAVDYDASTADIDGPISEYFRGIRHAIGTSFLIGSYGGGTLHSRLLEHRFVDLAWISMSRLFNGTQGFFYSNRWAMRQLPPEQAHAPSGIDYDRNILRIPRAQLGVFRVDDNGVGRVIGATAVPTPLATPVLDVAASGTLRYVATDGLKLRASPNGTKIRELDLATPVQDMGAGAVAGWRKVKVGDASGVVWGDYLRDPARPEVEALVRATVDEWLRFDKGSGNEDKQPWRGYVREMWARIGEPYDGASKYPSGEDVPWSAAFISWVVHRAGPAYKNFRFTAGHAAFVHHAIKSRVVGDTSVPFWGYPIDKAKPELGDIVQRNRGGGNFSFAYAESHSSYVSHSDIVVEVRPDVIRVIGGNVGDTVSMKSMTRSGDNLQDYALDANGHIKAGQGVIAVLKNRAGLAG